MGDRVIEGAVRDPSEALRSYGREAEGNAIWYMESAGFWRRKSAAAAKYSSSG